MKKEISDIWKSETEGDNELSYEEWLEQKYYDLLQLARNVFNLNTIEGHDEIINFFYATQFRQTLINMFGEENLTPKEGE